MSEQDKVKELWEAPTKQVKHSLGAGEERYWIIHPTVRQCINEVLSGDRTLNLFDVIRTKFEIPFDRVLVLGSAAGSGRNLLRMQSARFVDVVEPSSTLIEEARKDAASAGLSSRINFKVMDLNNPSLPPEKYDMVLANMSMHNIKNLEQLFEQVRGTLKPSGLFIVNDYVGPSRYLFQDKQIELMNWLLDLLPPQYKIKVTDGAIKGSIAKLEEKNLSPNSTDSIRSGEIIQLLEKYFEPVMRKDYGGTLLQFALADIVGNFSPDELKDVTMLRMIYKIEQLLIREKVIESDFVFMVLKKKT